MRQKLKLVFEVQAYRTKLSMVLRLCAVIGFLWIFAFPYIAQDVFTSEKALDGNYLQSVFRESPQLTKSFDEFKEALEQLSHKEVKNYVLSELNQRGETHIQQLTHGSNLYTYLRTKDGTGNECIALAAPLNKKPGIALMLTFIDLMVKFEPKWQSKDILILFYE